VHGPSALDDRTHRARLSGAFAARWLDTERHAIRPVVLAFECMVCILSLTCHCHVALPSCVVPRMSGLRAEDLVRVNEMGRVGKEAIALMPEHAQQARVRRLIVRRHTQRDTQTMHTQHMCHGNDADHRAAEDRVEDARLSTQRLELADGRCPRSSDHSRLRPPRLSADFWMLTFLNRSPPALACRRSSPQRAQDLANKHLYLTEQQQKLQQPTKQDLMPIIRHLQQRELERKTYQ
jgi:hypothetical protein